MTFIGHIIFAVAVIAVGAGIVFAVGTELYTIFPWSFLIANVMAQFWLFFAALRERARPKARFDMIVAAETLVALGVFSLILGIVLAVAATIRANISIGNSTPQQLGPILTLFAEGLLSSALAPLLATVLRQIEVLRYASASTESDTSPLGLLKGEAETLAGALKQVQISVKSAGKAVTAFTEIAESIAYQLDSVAKNIEGAKTIVPSVLSDVASGINSSGSGVNIPRQSRGL